MKDSSPDSPLTPASPFGLRLVLPRRSPRFAFLIDLRLIARRALSLALAAALVSPAQQTSAQQTPAQHSNPTPPDSTRRSDSSQRPAPTVPVTSTGTSAKPAAGVPTAIPTTAPAPPPSGPVGRPRIGLALGGGGALAMTSIGVLDWFEQHHIPVDCLAGTSMGALVGALYATGRTPDQIVNVVNNNVFEAVFRLDTAYKNLNFRRREDSRELPNGVNVGLRHGISLRNSLLIDQGLNGFLDRQFYRYDDRSEFNALPVPFRAIATDITDAQAVTFARGSIPDAVRASVSLPGIYRPFLLDGHEYVDGGVLDNLPTATVRNDLRADVVLAVSLPLQPPAKGSLDSIVGVLQRSFAVAIEANERRSRTLADVVVMPDVTGFTANDYLKARQLADRGYDAAEAHRDQLLRYALDDAQWQQYLRERAARLRPEPGPLLRVRVTAPSPGVQHAVQQLFDPIVGKPLDTSAVEALLNDVRSDGRYDADYSVTYENASDDRPSILVSVHNKSNGPPFMLVGANVQAETSAPPRATVEGTFVYQDLGGYGSELRAHARVGWFNQFDGEYFRRLPGPPVGGRLPQGARIGEFFVAPNGGILRQPFYIYRDQLRLSERQLQLAGGGADLGWTDQRSTELRAGWEYQHVDWQTQVGSGSDGLPDVHGGLQRARARLIYDTQDRDLVPQYGLRLIGEAGYLFHAAASPPAPQFTLQGSFAHSLGANVLAFHFDSGTMLDRNVAQPYRFTLGGPFRLTASAFDEYRGTDYFLVSPVLLHRIGTLPQPLGQHLYVGASYEAGQMRAPFSPTVTRQDILFGFVAETPLGAITVAPAIGDAGRRKLVFTLGRLF